MLWRRTSRPLKTRSLVLLSGERTSIPAAEAKALFLASDPGSRFEEPEDRVLVAESQADPMTVSRRIAFSRRVGLLLSDGRAAAELVRGKSVRVRSFPLPGGRAPPEPDEVIRGLEVRIDLKNPEFEFTVVCGREPYLALTAPRLMKQGWSGRRPRRRAFFHPAAIFPKLSRALVNLSRCGEGSIFLDPFVGTGSLAIEAYEIGARVIGLDLSEEMAKGALANMRGFGQEWLGVVRCDSLVAPLRTVDAVATDVPYGRASSTRGRSAADVIQATMLAAHDLLKPGSWMVMMHARELPHEQGSGWDLDGEHHLYVHKRLTRTISVLRRR